MGDLLYDLVAWMSDLPQGWIYFLILVVAYGENVLPPIPGDMIVVFGGYLAGLGRLDVVVVVFLSTVGGSAGFMSMYGLGSKLGTALLTPGRYRWLPKKRFLAARAHLAQWGYGLVAANRFLSGLRSVISLSVGMAHKPVGPTFFWSTVSALVWTILLTAAGFYVGENWEVVGEYLRRYGEVVVIIMVAFVVVQLTRFWFSRRVPENAVRDDS